MQEKLLDKQLNLVNRIPFSKTPSLPLTPSLMKISPAITTLSARWKLNDSITLCIPVCLRSWLLFSAGRILLQMSQWAQLLEFCLSLKQLFFAL